MWLEAILTEADLAEAMKELLPFKVHLGGEGPDANPDRWLALGSASAVALVADDGLRVTCPATLSWSIAGVSTTFEIDELRVLLRPEVVEKHKGHSLELQFEVEEADFHRLPGFVDTSIIKAVNAALAARRIPWDFTATLTRTVGLGKMLEPIEALRIAVQWGKLRVGADAIALAVSFKLDFVRGD